MDTDKWKHGSCKQTKRTTFLHWSYSWVIPQHDLVLSRVGFESLQLFWDWTTLKAPKLFPTVIHMGLVGHFDPHPLQATNGKGSIWIELFCESIGRLTPHESWLLASPKFSYGRRYYLTVWMCAWCFIVSGCLRRDKNTSIFSNSAPLQFNKTDKQISRYE